MTREELREAWAKVLWEKHYPGESYIGWDKVQGQSRRDYLADADAILSAIDAAGMVVVPVEPTEEMIDAAAETPGMLAASSAMTMHQARGDGFDAGAFTTGSPLHQAWSAMLDAARGKDGR